MNRLFPLFLSLLIFLGCKPEPSAEAMRVDEGFQNRFELSVNNVPLNARIAIQANEQRNGLMHIKSMPKNEGMLFLYRTPKKMSFWMANTFIPLDIAFFDRSGKLLEIRQMYPHVTTAVESSSDKVQFAIEMNQGWFARNNLKPGSQMNLSLLAQAIKRRGLNPSLYMDN